MPQLENLDALFRVLLKARHKRGAIDFDTAETRMVFDDNGKITSIEPYERNDAHRLIEECMLAANVCASEFLLEKEQLVLYRTHPEPKPAKVEKLRDFLGTFGLQLTGGDTPHAKDYAKLLEKLQGRPDKLLLQTVMLRSLQQAIYSPDNVGHFGLAAAVAARTSVRGRRVHCQVREGAALVVTRPPAQGQPTRSRRAERPAGRITG